MFVNEVSVWFVAIGETTGGQLRRQRLVLVVTYAICVLNPATLIYGVFTIMSVRKPDGNFTPSTQA